MSRPPSDFFRGRYYDPRVNFFDLPISERERMRDREMRIRSHLQHPGYQFRDRSPVGFPRQWDSSGFGFASPFEDHEGRFFDQRPGYRGDYPYDQAVEYNNLLNDGRDLQGYFCGDNDFYFFSEDGLCYDAQGFTYRFEEDGFYYDVVSGGRHDSGGFACDEKGVRICDKLGTSVEDTGTNDPPPRAIKQYRRRVKSQLSRRAKQFGRRPANQFPFQAKGRPLLATRKRTLARALLKIRYRMRIRTKRAEAVRGVPVRS